tara:strand:+ start:993 stop:1448 length:456 start_codon:yes stop_codon:yes gene_type:complete
MINYETMYIVHPALESGRLKDLILSVEKSMHNLGGKTTAINVWGKKKLAYPINKERYGMYILFQFQSDGKSNKEFNLGLDHNSNILAYLTTKIDADSIISDLPNLDEQLGLSTSKNEENVDENNEKSNVDKSDNNSESDSDESSDNKEKEA